MKIFYKCLLASLLFITAVLLPFLLGYLPVNLAVTKDSIRQYGIEAFDIDVQIRGVLQLRLGLTPRLSASQISLGSPDSALSRLIEIETLEIRPRLFAMLSGDLHLRALEASDILIDYCPRWLPKTETAQPSKQRPSVAVDNLLIRNIRPHCESVNEQFEYMVDHVDVSGSAGLDDALKIKVLGKLKNESFELTASSTSLDSVLNNPTRVPFSLALETLSGTAKIEGALETLLNEPSVDAEVSLVIVDLGAATKMFGVGVLPIKSVEFSSRLNLSETELRLQAADLTIEHTYDTSIDSTLDSTLESNSGHSISHSISHSNVKFDGSLKDFYIRPNIDIALQIQTLDLALLKLKEAAAEEDSNAWQSMDLAPWFTLMQKFDGQLKLAIETLTGLPVSAKKINLNATLNQGELFLDRLDLLLAGTNVQGGAGLNVNAACPQFNTSLQADEFQLASLDQLLGQFLYEDLGLEGEIQTIAMDTSSCGATPIEFLESLSVDSTITNTTYYHQGQVFAQGGNTASLQFGPQLPGHLNFNGVLEGEPVSVEIAFASINKIVSESSWPIALSAEGGGGRLLLNGDAAIVDSQVSLDGRAEFNTQQFGILTSHIDVDTQNPIALKADSRIVIDQGVLRLTEIDVSLGQSNLDGDVVWPFEKADGVIRTSLHSSYLDVEELKSLVPLQQSGITTGDLDVDEWENLEWIQGWFDLPAVDFNVAVDKVHGFNSDVQDLALVGKVSEGLVDHAQLKLIFEEIEMEGFLYINLLEENWVLESQFAAKNVDIAQLLARFDMETDNSVKAERLSFSVISEGQSIIDLAKNSRVESRLDDLLWHPGNTTGNESEKLFLSYLEFVTTPRQTALGSGQGTINGVPINLFVRTPPVTKLTDKTESLPFTLFVSFEKQAVMIDALISERNKPDPVTELTISGQDLATVKGTLIDKQSPLADYQLHTYYSAGLDSLHFSDIEAQIGDSIVLGRLDINLNEGINHFEINAVSPHLDANDLVMLVENLSSFNPQSDHQAASDSSSDSSSSDPRVGFLTSLNQKISDIAEFNTLDLHVEVEQLWSNEKLLGKAQLSVNMQEDEFRIAPLSIVSDGGNFNLEYETTRVAQGVTSLLNVNVENFEFSELSRLLNPESTDKGFIYFDASLSSEAKDWTSLNSGLQGAVDLAVFPEGISADVLDLWASNLVWALLPSLPGTTKQKQINCLAARFDVDEGVMTTQKLLLDTTDILVHGRGNINLARREVDLLFSPQAKLEKYLSVSAPIKVKGPFDGFTTRIPQGGFVTTLLRLYMNTIYVPYKWFSGERFPADGIATCYNAMGWEFTENSQ